MASLKEALLKIWEARRSREERMMHSTRACLAMALILAGMGLRDVRAQATNAAVADAEFARLHAAHGDDTNRWVRRGVIADRAARRVTLLAESTGIARNEIMEFGLIHEASSHGYEAFAMAFARPGDIREALTFIGLPAGRPIRPELLAFWPKGERVRVSVSPRGEGVWKGPVRMERLVWHTQSKAPMPEAGYVFTGSERVPGGSAGEAGAWRADVEDPQAIIANYNEPAAVMEIPRQAGQGDVYSTYTMNPEYLLPKGGLLDVVIEPEPTDHPRVLDLRLNVRAEGGSGMAAVTFNLADAAGQPVLPAGDPSKVVEAFKAMVDRGQDPFVTLSFDPGMTLGTIHTVCVVLSGIEGEHGIRVEPPPPGQLYYKAFLPDERNRRRDDRIAQPWELWLGGTVGSTQTVSRLVKIDETWIEGEPRPKLAVQDFPVPTPADLRSKLSELGPGIPVILVFAAAETPLSRVLDFIAPVRDTHGTVHVYIDPMP